MAFEMGGHWLITAERVGLHMGLSQLFFDNATSIINDGSATGQTVTFTRGRRLQAEVYAFPMTGALQVYGGGGFLINYISDALPEGTFASAQAEQAALQTIDEANKKPSSRSLAGRSGGSDAGRHSERTSSLPQGATS